MSKNLNQSRSPVNLFFIAWVYVVWTLEFSKPTGYWGYVKHSVKEHVFVCLLTWRPSGNEVFAACSFLPQFSQTIYYFSLSLYIYIHTYTYIYIYTYIVLFFCMLWFWQIVCLLLTQGLNMEASPMAHCLKTRYTGNMSKQMNAYDLKQRNMRYTWCIWICIISGQTHLTFDERVSPALSFLMAIWWNPLFLMVKSRLLSILESSKMLCFYMFFSTA